MQINARILLVIEDDTRYNTIKTILDFLGERNERITKQHFFADDSLLRFRAVIIDTQLVTDEQLALLAEERPWQPKLTIGTKRALDSENVIGHIEEPLNYEQLTELLHACQIYGKDQQYAEPPQPGAEKLFRSLVGRSSGIAHVRNLIAKVAPSEANVLVLGESGTGKEVVARNIHYLSNRQPGPFVPVNCGAIPAELLESELFGHEKGAFTGALTARKGRFELADGGTLFLDEIGDMPLPMQVKLLRVLQERVFERVGGTTSIRANVRVVAATHRNMEKMIEQGLFREDLYYRLNVFPVEMPSLAQRVGDIPLLMQELVTRIEEEGKGRVRFTASAIDTLMAYSWPGNVRELCNLIERLTILFPNQLVDTSDLPAKYRQESAQQIEASYSDERSALNEAFQQEGQTVSSSPIVPSELPQEGLNLKDMLAELEMEMIRQALEQQDAVVSRAAEMLGIRRTTLVEKMRKYGMSKESIS